MASLPTTPSTLRAPRWSSEAAERANTPVIIMMYLGIDMPIDSLCRDGSRAWAPGQGAYALHLDHSPSFEAHDGHQGRLHLGDDRRLQEAH